MKLRDPLAAGAEQALMSGEPAIAAGAVTHAGPASIHGFVARHGIGRLAPLYPEVVRDKVRNHASGRELAEQVRQRFPDRAGRLRAAFQPPDISRTYVVELTDPAQDVGTAIAALNADPDVEFAELETAYATNYTPNDPYFTTNGTWGQAYHDLWGLYRLNTPTAWDSSTGRGIVVAVIDTGIDYRHADIAANVWANTKEVAGNGVDDDKNGFIDDVRGWNFIANGNDPADDNGHGTHVAGTIAAVGGNGLGVIGVAWQAKVMALKGLDAGGGGVDSTLAPAIVYAANHGADILNLSWGGQGKSKSIADALEYAYNMGVVILASAGNSQSDALNYYPAGLSQAIAVAASAPNDDLASFSNWGSKIDTAAPGVDILSLRASGTSLGTAVGQDYCRLSGTSMAAPHVSGLAALLLSRYPDYSNEDVRQAIRASAQDAGDSGYDLSFGYGITDASAAVALTGVLEAKITDPTGGATAETPVTISGLARGEGFAQYKLEYGSGRQPASWTVLTTSTVAATGALGVFDPTAVPSGLYVIRLTVYNQVGRTFTDRIEFRAASVAINSPAPPTAPTAASTFKPGAVIPVEGAMDVSGFRSFKVEWAKGIHPDSGWRTAGMSVVGGGTSPVAHGTVAKWNTSQIAEAGYYTIRLTVVKATIRSTASTFVYLEPDLLSSDWPKFLYRGVSFNTGVLPARGADGQIQLVGVGDLVNGRPPNVFWRLPLEGEAQATTYPGWGTLQQVSVADLDRDGTDEVVDFESEDSVWVFRLDGTSSTFGPIQKAAFSTTQPEIEDVDGDSQWEIFALSNDFVKDTAYLYGWRSDGTALSGNFPLRISDRDRTRFSPNQRRFLIADLNGDGKKKIVVAESRSASCFGLSLFSSNGERQAWNTPDIPGRLMAMAAADLDHNGRIEVIAVAHDEAQSRNSLHVVQPDGRERAGWPVTLPGFYDYRFFLAVSDLDRNGREEVVFANQTGLYAYTADGALCSGQWPVLGPSDGFSAIAIGDVDGDALPEIVSTGHSWSWNYDPNFPINGYVDQVVFAFRADGTAARQWQLNGLSGYRLSSDAVPLIGDFNLDGVTDIALTYGVAAQPTPGPGAVTVLSTGAPFHPSANDWPMIYHDARNTGVRSRPAGGWDPGPWPGCTFSLNANTVSIPAEGGTAHLNVTTSPGCNWTVSSPPDWLRIAGGASGSGSGTIRLAAGRSKGPLRTATLAIMNQHVTIRQEAYFEPVGTVTGSMAHIALGCGWNTSLAFVNTATTPFGFAKLDFYGDDGRGLALPFTSPVNALEPWQLRSDLGWPLVPNALFVADATGGAADDCQTGAVHSRSDPAISGLATFSNTLTGQAAVVPLETRKASPYVLSFDNTGGLETGVAIANIASARASVGVIIRGDAGQKIGSGTISLAAKGHSSFMLTDPVRGFQVTAGQRGVIEFHSPEDGELSVLGLRVHGAAITTLPVLTTTETGGGTIAHFASGEGWETLITVVNTGASETNATLTFRGDSGSLVELPVAFPQTGATMTASSLTLTLAAGASTLIETRSDAARAVRGWARLETNGSVGAFAIFRNSGQEAVVPLQSAAVRSNVLIFDNTNQFATGVALANASARSAAVTATLRDSEGRTLGKTTIGLPAWGHTAPMLTELFPAAVDMHGTVSFEVPAGGQIDALGIRATPSGAYTAIPPIAVMP